MTLHYPKFDGAQKRTKVMSKVLGDMIVNTLQKGGSN